MNAWIPRAKTFAPSASCSSPPRLHAAAPGMQGAQKLAEHRPEHRRACSRDIAGEGRGFERRSTCSQPKSNFQILLSLITALLISHSSFLAFPNATCTVLLHTNNCTQNIIKRPVSCIVTPFPENEYAKSHELTIGLYVSVQMRQDPAPFE